MLYCTRKHLVRWTLQCRWFLREIKCASNAEYNRYLTVVDLLCVWPNGFLTLPTLQPLLSNIAHSSALNNIISGVLRIFQKYFQRQTTRTTDGRYKFYLRTRARWYGRVSYYNNNIVGPAVSVCAHMNSVLEEDYRAFVRLLIWRLGR